MYYGKRELLIVLAEGAALRRSVSCWWWSTCWWSTLSCALSAASYVLLYVPHFGYICIPSPCFRSFIVVMQLLPCNCLRPYTSDLMRIDSWK